MNSITDNINIESDKTIRGESRSNYNEEQLSPYKPYISPASNRKTIPVDSDIDINTEYKRYLEPASDKETFTITGGNNGERNFVMMIALFVLAIFVGLAYKSSNIPVEHKEIEILSRDS